MFVAGLATFSLASLACGLAPDATTLVLHYDKPIGVVLSTLTTFAAAGRPTTP